MKKNKIITVIALSVSLFSCKYNNVGEPPIPEMNRIVDKTAKVISIKQLKDLYRGKSTEITDNVIVEALVSSDDSDGNFYKTLTIQDNTAGIEVKLGQYSLSALYPQGCKVMVKCQGMVLGKYGDQINLGYRSNNPKYENGFYPEGRIEDIVKKIEYQRTLDPIVIKSFSQINESLQAKLVKLEGVQFSDTDINSTIGDTSSNKNPKPTKSTKLIFNDKKEVEVRTSGYARFAGYQIPKESGSVVGVLTFFRGNPQLTICKEKDIELNKPRF